MALNKKSQLYLLTAIFLSILVFLMVDMPAKTQPGSKESLMLYNNFVTEAPRVINGALYQGRDLAQDFDDFTDKFIFYAGTKNINLSIFCILVYGEEMVIYNKMGRDVNITTSSGEIVMSSSQQTSQPRDEKVNIEIDAIEYPFDIDNGLTEFKVIFIAKDSKNNKEVYIYG
jgi:hypothetical protein